MHPKQIKNIQSDILKEYSLDYAKTLEDEVEIITNAATKIESINKNLTEIRTENWYKLGVLLNEHMDHVRKQKGDIWEAWANDKFYPLIKPRRRQNCMALARLGQRIEPYYYMGIDRVLDLLFKLEDCHKKDKHDFEYAKKKFGFVFEAEPQTDEEKAHLNKSADFIREFFQFTDGVRHKNYDRELVADVIVSGGTFSKKDYEELNDSNKTKSDIENYLIKMLTTGSSPATAPTSQGSPESIRIILTKLVQTIDGYISSNRWPEYLEAEIVDEAIKKLNILNNSI